LIILRCRWYLQPQLVGRRERTDDLGQPTALKTVSGNSRRDNKAFIRYDNGAAQ
jgi:hypothetical protein